MKRLLMKELRLALHPTNLIFLSLSAFLMIPNYPYYVTFFYTALGLFFLCLNGRENHDIEYSLLLPIRKRDVVTARIGISVAIELAQLAVAILFALLHQRLLTQGNQVGMDANVALFGISLMLLGLFNLVFYLNYYAAPSKVGKAFVLGSTVMAVGIVLAEALAHALPFMRDRLDTPDPQYLGEKLLTLALGVLVYAGLTLWAARGSIHRFEALDQ